MLLLLLTRSFNKELETSRKGGPATKITLGTTPNSLPNCEINSCSVGMINPGRMRTIIVARDAILGPIKNKPVQLPDGSILSPTSTEENKLFGLWKVQFELSKDGKNWEAALVLEKDPGEYSYPAIIQTADGMVHITYTWKRLRVRHLMIDPAMLSGKAIVDLEWRK